MFCGKMPCVCNKKPEKEKAPRKPKVEKLSIVKAPEKTGVTEEIFVSVPRVDVREAMKARVQRRKDEVKAATDYEVDDAEFVSAIQALESILHPEEKMRFARTLAVGKTLDDRRKAWRERVRR